MEDKRKVCAVCGYVLDRFSQNGVLVGWLHFIPREEDHVVVPVDPNDIQYKQKCDFCSSEDPTAWVLPAKSFEMFPETSIIPGQMSDGAWGACDACGLLIRADRWSALITRVRQKAAGPVPRSALQYLYSRLQANVTEKILPYDEWRARQSYPSSDG